jgi:hypothetical protein
MHCREMDAAAVPRRRWLKAGGLLLVLAILTGAALLARTALFGVFVKYDDEGYMLLALRAWREGGGLYDRVETIYGPFYFQAVVAMFALLRLPLDNSGARELMLGIWMASSLLCALYVWRVHRSWLATAAAWALSFDILLVLTKEPLHPGSLIVLLLPPIALASLRLAAPGERRGTWALLGVLTAAVALTKLNVGVFLALALCGTWLRFAARNKTALAARLVFSVLLVAFPFLLMHTLLPEPWVVSFALLVSASLLPFALLLFQPPVERPWSCASLSACAGGGLALGLVSFGICFATGSTWHGVWRCLVLDTLRFPAMFGGQTALPSLAQILGSVLVVPVAFLLRAVRHPASGLALFALKLAAAGYALDQCTTRAMPLATLPFLWLFAFPCGERSGRTQASAPVAFLSLMVTLQALHAYPIAGSQVEFFAFLIPVLAVVGLWDAWSELPAAWRERVPSWMARSWTIPAAALGAWALASFDPTWRALPARWQAYRDGEVELGLPGAEGLRLPELQATTCKWLAANLRHHGDTFLAMPGRHSFYLWTEERPPVPFYSAVWPLYYDEERQGRLGAALLAHENACVIRVPGVLNVWQHEGRTLPVPVLARRIDERFKVAGRVPGFELLIPKEKQADLILSAIPAELPAGVSDAHEGWLVLRLTLPEMGGVRLVRFALVQGESGAILCDSAAPAVGGRMTLADEQGVDRSGADGRPQAIVLDRRRNVLALCPASIPPYRTDTCLVRCYDERGQVAARLPVVR